MRTGSGGSSSRAWSIDTAPIQRRPRRRDGSSGLWIIDAHPNPSRSRRRRKPTANVFSAEDAEDRAEARAVYEALVDRIAQRQAELDAINEAEREAELAAQGEAQLVRETAQAAARRQQARELLQQLAAMEAQEEEVWRSGGNTNAMRQSRLQLRDQLAKIEREAAHIERRVHDADYRARTAPIVDPSPPPIIDRAREAEIHRAQHPWLHGYGQFESRNLGTCWKEAAGRRCRLRPEDGAASSVHVE